MVILVVVVAAILVTFLTLLVRYILIPFFLLLFPIAILLYFIPPTYDWGKALLKVTVIVVFMTSVDALILLGLSALFHSPDPNLAGDFIRSMAVLLGFASIGLVNVLLFLLAVTLVLIEGLRTIGEMLSYAMRIAILASFL